MGQALDLKVKIEQKGGLGHKRAHFSYVAVGQRERKGEKAKILSTILVAPLVGFR